MGRTLGQLHPKGLEQRGQQDRHAAPQQGEGQAHLPAQIQREGPVIPKGRAQGLFVKQPHGVLHRRTQRRRADKQQHRPLPYPLRQQEQPAGPQPVHRAQGEQQAAFPVPLGVAGQAGESHLKEKPQKAVKQKAPKPKFQTITPRLVRLTQLGRNGADSYPEVFVNSAAIFFGPPPGRPGGWPGHAAPAWSGPPGSPGPSLYRPSSP